eukprot:CAMPEP_0170457802 /NCGR_PEP_ID=MMETSP0123-20130129/4965_1 /TAXON_ID=182087 /ORGANISM="Favella ehrenbergii, Strain Fehren 1" /LENGTH=198 /DNA_ID=CAMNT_0010721701 /DNA_START=487 /DNA_END=1083 /DNA_ORIENTATION=+
MDEHSVLPHSLDLAVSIDEQALAIFDIILELADVDLAIRINLLRMPVARAVLEVPNDFRAVRERVTTVASQLRVAKLARVLIAIVEVDETLARHETAAKFSLIDPIVVVQHAEAVKEPIAKLTLVFQLVIRPLVDALAVEDSILELSIVSVTIRPLQEAAPVDHIRVHVPFVSVLDLRLFLASAGRLEPGHLSMAMHL